MKKLTSTHKIKIDAILRVYKKGFGYCKLQVLEVNEYFISLLSPSVFVNNAKTGDEIEIYLWVEDIASYEFELKLLSKIYPLPQSIQKPVELKNEISDSNPGILIFEHSDYITRYEDRRCLTAKVELDIEFFIFSPAHIKKNFTSEEVVFHKGKISELGDRQAKLQCSENLEDKSFLKGHLVVNNSEVEMVARVSKIDNNNYNLSFTGISDKERNILLDYIFSTYRE